MKAYGGLEVCTKEFKTLAAEYVCDCIRSPTAICPGKVRTGGCVGKIRRLGWAGHIIRMEEERIPKKVLTFWNRNLTFKF
jgi:hypothetical protein